MDDTESQTPLTDKALRRLRALANGNGVDPQKIVLTASEEKIYTFEGTTTLMPLFETRTERFSGPPRSKPTQTLSSFEQLKTDEKNREKSFRAATDWIPEVVAEVRKEPGEGWGVDGGRIELPKRALVIAATETCQKCRGRKILTCDQCAGRGYHTCTICRGLGQEWCYNCNVNNSGMGPLPTGQHCPVCNGMRRVQCRTCRGSGQIPCPTCQTRGNIPCTTCKGAGQTTEEMRITFGATAAFAFKAENLPSVMRRGLDRIGLINLTKGHATIALVEKEEEAPQKEEYIPGGLYGVAPPIAPGGGSALKKAPIPEDDDPGFGAPKEEEKKGPKPELHYTATMPFADLRVDFGGRKAVIGVFGLRNIFIDVPPFLDDFLNPALEKLHEAMRGKGSLDEALKIRALRESLELHLQSKGTLKEMRRLYPIGLSTGVAEKILRGTKNTVKRVTRLARSIAAVAGTLIGAGLSAACYFSPLQTRLLAEPAWTKQALIFAPPVIAAILGTIAINFATYIDLHRHFPEAKKARRQTLGHIVYAMLAAIVIVWLAILMLSPLRPFWLLPMIH